MKICAVCGATAFDDMGVCFACLSSFPAAEEAFGDFELEFLDDVEEPTGQSPKTLASTPAAATCATACRIRVRFPGQFLYDAYLAREEGAILRIGCAADNNIIIPQTAVGRHQMVLRYVHNQLWLEDQASDHPALLDGVPLTGTRRIQMGSVVQIGDALLSFQEDGQNEGE